ncbi:MAG: acetylhydrolase [Rhodoferax sp.]
MLTRRTTLQQLLLAAPWLSTPCSAQRVAPAHSAAPAPAADYDPLALPDRAAPTTVDWSLPASASQRALPLRAYLPARFGSAPVLVFSHGLGGSRLGSAFLGQHWAARGYAALFVQHPGSDEDVWRSAPPGQRKAALQAAANAQQLHQRVQDIRHLVDHLHAAPPPALAGRLDLAHLGVAGHSFGARTAQRLGGQTTPGWGAADPRIRAALLMSPSIPSRGDAASAFAAVRIPWMLMTGTQDVSPIGDTNVQQRLAVFDALPPGQKYLLVLHGATHAAFTDRALPTQAPPRNPLHHRSILALSTAFWDTHLRQDPAARAWLHGLGPRGVLQTPDRWQTG